MSNRKIYVPQGFRESSGWVETKTLRRTLDMARTRLVVICCTFILTFVVITGRLVDVSLLRGGGDGLTCKSLGCKNFRADILDRNGEILATSLRTSSLFANAKVVLDAKDATEKLLQVLPELNAKDTLQKLESGKGFVWLAHLL